MSPTPDPNRPEMHSINIRLEYEVWKRMRVCTNIGRGRDLPLNTLAKVVRTAVRQFLALEAPDQECPRVLRKRTNMVAGGRGTILDPPKMHRVEIPKSDYRALQHITTLGYWPSTAELIRYALDQWLDTNGRFSAEDEWVQRHDQSRDAWVERPRPYLSESIVRTVAEHNAWRDATHPKPRPKRRIYKPRKPKEETT